MSLVYEACLEDDAQRRHLEAGPGAHVGGLYEDDHALADAARAWVAAPAIERGLRFRPGTDFSEACVSPTAVRHDSLRLVSNLFGLLRPARRLFPPSMRRHKHTSSRKTA